MARPGGSAVSLARDQRGAILIGAVVMGALLTVAVLYLLEIGQAIVVRERLQDAADAAAFESAVWHARGMNATAVLNILMSAALAVMAVTRQIELVCLLVPGGQSCASALLRFETRAARYIDTSMNVVQQIQVGIAIQTPLMAAALSSGVPGSFAGDGEPVMSGGAASLALMPVAVDRLLQLRPHYEDGPEGAPHPGYRPEQLSDFPVRLPEVLGTPGLAFPSLPVQAGSFDELCGRASSFIPEQQDQLLDRYADVPGIRPVLDFIGGALTGPIARPLLRWAGEHFSDLLCRPAEDVLNQVVADIAGQACDGAEQNRERERTRIQQENEADPDGPQQTVPDPWSTQDQQTCMDDEEGEAREQQRVVHFDAVPAALYGLAENGNPFLHVWSTARTAGDGDTPSRSTVAEAEYYFDCDADCGEALWRPGWTARMRRFRMPWRELDVYGFATDQLMGSLRMHLGNFIGAHVESAVEDLLAGTACGRTSGGAGRLCEGVTEQVIDPITGWIKRKAQELVNGRFATGDAGVNNTAGNAAQGGASFGINWLIDAGLSRVTDFANDHGVELPDSRGYGQDPRIH